MSRSFKTNTSLACALALAFLSLTGVVSASVPIPSEALNQITEDTKAILDDESAKADAKKLIEEASKNKPPEDLLRIAEEISKTEKAIAQKQYETFKATGELKLKENQVCGKEDNCAEPVKVAKTVANPDHLYTYLISKAMGKSQVEELLKTYAGVTNVRFLLRGFTGDGNMGQGLKWILTMATKMDPPPNIAIDPVAFREYGVTAVPVLVISDIKAKEKESQESVKQKAEEIKNILEGNDFVSVHKAAEVIAKEHQAQQKKKREEEKASEPEIDLGSSLVREKDKPKAPGDPAPNKPPAPLLIVSGMASPDWAEERWEHLNGERLRITSMGATVAIEERDIIEVAKERVAKIDWEEKKRKALERFWQGQQKLFAHLPPAQRNQTRLVDARGIFPKDIKDAQGAVLFKAGTIINPFDKLEFNRIVIVFDPTDQRQFAIVKDRVEKYKKEGQGHNIKIILTRMDIDRGWDAYKEITDTLGVHAYLIQPEIINRFDLAVVPSIVTSAGDKQNFKVEEIDVTGAIPAVHEEKK